MENSPAQKNSIFNTNVSDSNKQEDPNSDNSLINYDEDKKNTEMEEGLENETDLEDNNPDDDKVDFEEEEEEEEELDLDDIDLDYKYRDEEEEEDSLYDYTDNDDIDSNQKTYYFLEDNFRRYNSIFDSYNYL